MVEEVEEVYLGEEVSVVSGPEVLEVHYPEDKLLIQLFLIKSNLSSENF